MERHNNLFAPKLLKQCSVSGGSNASRVRTVSSVNSFKRRATSIAILFINIVISIYLDNTDNTTMYVGHILGLMKKYTP